MAAKARGEQHIGLLNGIAAYGMWGLVPSVLAAPAARRAIEILAHRMVWSLAFVGIALVVMRRWAWAGELIRQPRKLGLITVAAAVITVNWGVYIWAVNSGHVVEASLGYFINPLVTIAMGVLILKERMRPSSGPRSASPSRQWSSSPSDTAARRGSPSSSPSPSPPTDW